MPEARSRLGANTLRRRKSWRTVCGKRVISPRTSSMDQPTLAGLLATLFPPPPKPQERALELYMVVDGARDERVYRAVYESRLDYECLFTGSIPYELSAAAPYLVNLTKESSFTRWVLEEGWGKGLGIFVWAWANTELLRRHFRRLLQVQDEQGRKLYFRYYDPRVLRTYLPTCTQAERTEFFGPVQQYLLESPDGQVLSYEVALKRDENHVTNRVALLD
jgi:hypothetical protein